MTELKVLVDGVERVVCGITEQTTVQEVVIALAQATGRTGRYTLVERYRENERLLPPAETPLTVLDRWGDHKHDVSFILRRSGTSDMNKRSDDSKFDKNQQTRQSLPITSGQSKMRRAGNNSGVSHDRNEKIRKSLGPGIRHRGDSNSSLPNNTNRQSGFFNTRSRSPQRRGISPSRAPRPPSKTRLPSPNRANMIETRKNYLGKVVHDQQHILKEMDDTLNRLSSNIIKLEHSAKGISDDEKRYADLIRQNEAKIAEEIERRSRNEAARANLEKEIRNSKQELQSVDLRLNKNIHLERSYSKQLDEKRNSIEMKRKLKSQDTSNTQDEIRRVVLELRTLDKLIQEKKDEVEKLNRDLRKVNLQSFVRESNSSKVTVLPETGPDPSRKVKMPEPKQNETSSGVWV